MSAQSVGATRHSASRFGAAASASDSSDRESSVEGDSENDAERCRDEVDGDHNNDDDDGSDHAGAANFMEFDSGGNTAAAEGEDEDENSGDHDQGAAHRDFESVQELVSFLNSESTSFVVAGNVTAASACVILIDAFVCCSHSTASAPAHSEPPHRARSPRHSQVLCACAISCGASAPPR